MVASIAGAPPGSTVVRRAETPTNKRDRRSGNRDDWNSAQSEDPASDEDGRAEDRRNVTSTLAGGLTVEGLLTVQQLQDEDRADTVPKRLPKSPY